MNFELMTDMFDAAPELWYFLALVFVLLIAAIIYNFLKILRLKQKNYFLNRDRERYAETLYASRDGYFAFVYPDEKVNDPRKKIFERCSRRLAVVLNLSNGTNSSFEDILKCFYKDDAKKIVKYAELLMEEGVSFEETFTLKNNTKQVMLSASRINGIDGNVYCDMIWFRDISFEADAIAVLEKEKQQIKQQMMQLQDLLDAMDLPVWLRDDKGKIVFVNRRYLDFIDAKNKKEAVERGEEILNVNGESVSKNLAFLALKANKPKTQKANVVLNGERISFEAAEFPFYGEENLDKIYTTGVLIDVSELDCLKRNLKTHQNAHLEILSSLGTAFAVFDAHKKLAFYNKAFREFWKLEEVFLETKPAYNSFLEVIRSNRMLPEVPDFSLYKQEEEKEFGNTLSAKEDLMHLPDGKTFRRVRLPHPAGGMIFAFEDITDRLAAARAYNSLLNVKNQILDNIFDAVLIFTPQGKLDFYNRAYIKLWSAEESFLKNRPNILEVIESQKKLFGKIKNWKEFKQELLEFITNRESKGFILPRSDETNIEILTCSLSDESTMVTYRRALSDES